MKKQQEVILGMLKEIDEVCRKNDIRYFAAAGTLLGGCRHRGFIPWDDDADIWMPLDQYVKFREACKTQLPPGRMLRSAETLENYWHHLAHYTNMETTCFHRCESFLQDMTAGEVIDIFILDPISDDPEEQKAYLKDLGLYASVLTYGLLPGERWDPESEDFEYYSDLILSGKKTKAEVHDMLEERLATHFSDDGKYYMCRYAPYPSLFERASFERGVDMQFQDAVLMAPCNAHDCLVSVYGDDWMLMPMDPPMVKHNTASSLEFPPSEALDYFARPDFKKYFKEEYRRRKISIATAKETHDLDDRRCAMRATLLKMGVERKMQDPEIRAAFDKAYAEKDGLALAEILGDYLAQQLTPDMLGRRNYAKTRRFYKPYLADLEPDVYEGAICALLSTERLDQAWRFIDAWEKKGKELTPYMVQVREAITLGRHAVACHQRFEFETGLAEVRRILETFPKINTYNQYLCLMLSGMWNVNGDKDALEQLKVAADNGLQLFPGDGFYMKFQAEYLEATQGMEVALPLYKEAAENTTNGVALYDITKRTGYSPTWQHQSEWAEFAGLERYEKPQDENTIMANEPYQELLYGLLCEVVDVCEANGIDYMLGKATAGAMLMYGRLPRAVNGFRILLDQKGLKKLKGILQENCPDNREVGSAMLPVVSMVRNVGYYDKNTTLISLRRMGKGGISALNATACRTKTLSGASYYGRNVSGILKRLFTTPEVVEFTFRGRTFKTQKEFLEKWVDYREKHPGALGKEANLSRFLMSVDVPYSDFFACGGFDEDYFELRDKIVLQRAEARRIYNKCNTEYMQLQMAVHLKEISLDLKPKKDEILALYAQKDWDALNDVLADYIELLTTNVQLEGTRSFDQQIFAIATETYEHTLAQMEEMYASAGEDEDSQESQMANDFDAQKKSFDRGMQDDSDL